MRKPAHWLTIDSPDVRVSESWLHFDTVIEKFGHVELLMFLFHHYHNYVLANIMKPSKLETRTRRTKKHDKHYVSRRQSSSK